MKLGSIRELSGLKPVLKDPNATGPDPVYWVFSEVSDTKWANITIITHGHYHGEFPKTFGHYHGSDVNETYYLVEGKGILLMQKKFIDQNGDWIPEKVSEVYLVEAHPGDEILITPDWGHSWSNVGETPLISFDDWRSGHKESDYTDIKNLQGMAYYLVYQDKELGIVPNPNYRDLPEPKWITAKQFAELK